MDPSVIKVLSSPVYIENIPVASIDDRHSVY